MIVQPENMDFGEQKFSAIIYGQPGIGKTTLALSAPKPVLIDFDRGISRVRAQHRKAAIVCSNYEEVLRDVRSSDMAEYETVVIDTGGSFVTFLKDWAFRTKAGAKTKSGEFNSMKGFGYVKTEFAGFTDELKYVLGKHIIYVFHSQEEKDKDGNAVQRLLCEGSARNTVWNPCDFGGFVQAINGKRYIGFTPEQEYFAKGCHGITGRYEIPELKADTPNDFMTRLFAQARANIQAETDTFAPVREQYEKTMAAAQVIIDGVADVETANAAVVSIKDMEHALTSRKELGALLNAKAAACGLFFDKVLGQYTAAPPVKKEG